MNCPYETLGIPKDSNQTQIKTAFWKLALKFHPDRNPNSLEADKRFKEINAAYDVLKNPSKKSQYDKYGSRSEFARDPFEDFFADTPFSKKVNRVRGRHIRVSYLLSLNQAWAGASLELTIATLVECKLCQGLGMLKTQKSTKCNDCNGKGVIRRRQGFITFEQTCFACKGSGLVTSEACNKCGSEGRVAGTRSVQFNSKPGVEANTVVEFASQGEAGSKGGGAGNLCVRINTNLHPFYARQNADLFCTVSVSAETARLGGRLEFKTVGGALLALTVPKRTQNNSQLVLKHRGLPTGNGEFGNLHIKLEARACRYGTFSYPLKFSKRVLQTLFDLNKLLKPLITNQ
ncbi:MAG: DnaJ domain-containing protein [Candidatus Hodgkinia cicadicola]|nr:MAG: DnaJ domain-containing protein [Candidatus Hodgkinia cicadicola]